MFEESGNKFRVDQLRSRIESSLKDIVKQAKEAEVHLAGLQAKIAKLDKESAKSEFLKVRTKLQGELERVSKDFGLNSEKLRDDLSRARTRAQETLKMVKAQIQTIADAERTKRRGRSRSE